MNASDREVVFSVRAGHADAFDELVERYQRRLFGLVLMIVREPSGAEEVTQDAFVRAFTYLDRYDDRQPFYTWLATIGARLAQNWLRHRWRIVRREGSPLEDAHPPAAPPRGLHDVIEGERALRLWAAVSALPLGERTATLMHYRDEMTVRDIGKALGVTPGTIKTLLFRARRRLRTQLEGSFSFEETS